MSIIVLTEAATSASFLSMLHCVKIAVDLFQDFGSFLFVPVLHSLTSVSLAVI